MGLGDMVAALTSAFGIEPCSACKRRAAILNRWGENARAAFFGGPGACDLALEERAGAEKLLSDLERRGEVARRVLGGESALGSAIGWFQGSVLRGALYGCAEFGTFMSSSSTRSSSSRAS